MNPIGRRLLAVAPAVLLILAGCGSPPAGQQVPLRLGYQPNITHAGALVGVRKGIFSRDLGGGVTLQPQTFNAGPGEVEGIFANSLDAAYMGPNPAINAFAKSHGEAIRIVSGATSGGALLVVKPSITSPAGLRGKRLADPQLGGTQDVALRTWLASQGFHTDVNGGASFLASDIVTLFASVGRTIGGIDSTSTSALFTGGISFSIAGRSKTP